ncbi:MAG: hypothetical protein ACR2FZ_04160 [Thermoleophilaceae bacterium]
MERRPKGWRSRQEIPAFGSPLPPSGCDEKTVKLGKPGDFKYFCTFHRFMEGTVEVVE